MEEDLGLNRLSSMAERMRLRANEFAKMSDEEQEKALSAYLQSQNTSIEQAKVLLASLKLMLAGETKRGLVKVDETANAKLVSFFKEGK